jgi:hypothetical protein
MVGPVRVFRAALAAQQAIQRGPADGVKLRRGLHENATLGMPVGVDGSDAGGDGKGGDRTVANSTAANCIGARVTTEPGKLTCQNLNVSHTSARTTSRTSGLYIPSQARRHPIHPQTQSWFAYEPPDAAAAPLTSWSSSI